MEAPSRFQIVGSYDGRARQVHVSANAELYRQRMRTHVWPGPGSSGEAVDRLAPFVGHVEQEAERDLCAMRVRAR